MLAEPKWRQRDRKYRREPHGGSKSARSKADLLSMGTEEYIWRIDEKDMRGTRSDHLRLNGQKFRWDDPPVVNGKTGERGHPGMDKHCRCYAEPVMPSASEVDATKDAPLRKAAPAFRAWLWTLVIAAGIVVVALGWISAV